MTLNDSGADELTAPAREAENSTEHDRLAETVLSRLAAAGFFPARQPQFASERFAEFDKRVRASFSVPHTTMTSLARRILFGIASAHRPQTTVVLGTFVGYASVWLFGPALPPEPVYTSSRMIGCDILEPAVAQAQANFAALCHDGGAEKVQLVAADAYVLLDQISEPIDLLYLDVDSQQRGKKDYLGLLERAEKRLNRNALVLAHDVTHPFYAADVVDYQRVVRDKSRFRRTATLDIDPCGLEVTLV